MPTVLPLSLRQRDPVESIFEDIAPYAGSTIDQRSRMLSELCRWAVEQATARPDLRMLEREDRRSLESELLWSRLVKESRNREPTLRTAGRPAHR